MLRPLDGTVRLPGLRLEQIATTRWMRQSWKILQGLELPTRRQATLRIVGSREVRPSVAKRVAAVPQAGRREHRMQAQSRRLFRAALPVPAQELPREPMQEVAVRQALRLGPANPYL